LKAQALPTSCGDNISYPDSSGLVLVLAARLEHMATASNWQTHFESSISGTAAAGNLRRHIV
jgi:hypothetical protein